MTKRYIAHIADDRISIALTACRAPWQGWQVPTGYEHDLQTLPPYDQPRLNVDEIHKCAACFAMMEHG